MIKFISTPDNAPYRNFFEYYSLAKENDEPLIEAIHLSSIDNKLSTVDSRVVNLKYISGENWVFFTNYKSPKAIQFQTNNNISVVIFWKSVNVQIRLKAKITILESSISDKYFKERAPHKNALAISSNQSNKIDSYKLVNKKYEKTLSSNRDLTERPKYWGGYSFTPYYFEFWKGHPSRVNERHVYNFQDYNWEEYYLEP